MTDWDAIAKAKGIALAAERVEALEAVLEEMEATLASWKGKLTFDIEPTPVFRPVLTERGEEE